MATKIIHATGTFPFDLTNGASPSPPFQFDYSVLNQGDYGSFAIGLVLTTSGGAQWGQNFTTPGHPGSLWMECGYGNPFTPVEAHLDWIKTNVLPGGDPSLDAGVGNWWSADVAPYAGAPGILWDTGLFPGFFKDCQNQYKGYGQVGGVSYDCKLFYYGIGTIHVTDIFAFCPNLLNQSCTGTGGGGGGSTGNDIGEDMVADMMDNVIVCAWTDNSGTLQTSVQRHPEKAIGQTQVNQAWTSPLTLGTSIKRYLGLMYLPGSDLFLTTAAAGSSGSWINRKHGGDVAGDWLAQAGQNGQYSAVGRGQESAFFFHTGNTWSTPPPSAPADTGNIIQWLRSDVTNLQSPVVDGDDIAIGWTDISGAFNDSSTGGTQPPLYKTNQVNGHDSVRFSGANSCFMQGSFTLNPPFHIFAVMKQIAWTSNHILLGDWTGAASTKFKLVQHTASPKISINDGTGFSTDNADLPVGTWAIVEIIIPSSGALTLRVNNGTSTAGLNPVSGDRGGIALATARGASSTLYGNVEFAEVITYQVALNTTDADTTRAYLNGQYNCY